MSGKLKPVLVAFVWVIPLFLFMAGVWRDSGVRKFEIADMNSMQRPSSPLPTITPAIEAGKKLFNQYCLSCHNVKRTHATILGFENRGPWADRQKLWEWLVDPKAFMKKDRYTAAMYEEFQVLQTPFPDITRQQSDQIADYLIYVNKTRSRE
jgi:mono/diheme cytochrome c family protein